MQTIRAIVREGRIESPRVFRWNHKYGTRSGGVVKRRIGISGGPSKAAVGTILFTASQRPDACGYSRWFVLMVDARTPGD